MEIKVDRETNIKALIRGLLMFALSGLIVFVCIHISSLEYKRYDTAQQLKRAHEQAQGWREFEEAIAGLRPAESLKGSKSIEFVQLVRVIHTNSSAKGAALIRLMSLPGECSSNNWELSQDCHKLEQAFALLASERFDRLVKGDASALTPVAPLPAEIVMVKKPVWQASWMRLGIIWIVASFLAVITVFFTLVASKTWSKWSWWLYVTAWILFFPAMAHFHLSGFFIFLPIWATIVTIRKWRLHQHKKLIREIEPHLAVLWPERKPYRDRFADTDREKLRVLSEDNKTPPYVRVRIAKLIRIEESLFGPLVQKTEVEHQAAGQPAEQQPATQTA